MPRADGRPHQAREQLILRLRGYLERHHYPRLAMCAVLALGGLVGFLTSAGLLMAGVGSMAWRYGLAALAGYAAFLAGLRVWLRLHGRPRPDRANPLEGLDFPVGAGGDVPDPSCPAPGEIASNASAFADAADVVGGLDEGAAIVVPVLIAGFVVVGLVSVVMVLVGAPGLLAELLLDGVIAGAAYHRLRDVPLQHWLHGAVRRTWKPMLALTITLVAVGLLAQWVQPTADSIGDFIGAASPAGQQP